jgi:hypothetical protein
MIRIALKKANVLLVRKINSRECCTELVLVRIRSEFHNILECSVYDLSRSKDPEETDQFHLNIYIYIYVCVCVCVCVCVYDETKHLMCRSLFRSF